MLSIKIKLGNNMMSYYYRKQVRGFMKYFSISFLWAFFQWFFTGKDGYCGFAHFPTFGMEAWKHTYVLVFPLSISPIICFISPKLNVTGHFFLVIGLL